MHMHFFLLCAKVHLQRNPGCSRWAWLGPWPAGMSIEWPRDDHRRKHCPISLFITCPLTQVAFPFVPRETIDNLFTALCYKTVLRQMLAFRDRQGAILVKATVFFLRCFFWYFPIPLLVYLRSIFLFNLDCIKGRLNFDKGQ